MGKGTGEAVKSPEPMGAILPWSKEMAENEFIFKSVDPALKHIEIAVRVGVTSGQSYEAEVLGIIDGDTLQVKLPPFKTPQRVRLLGIDAPETGSDEHARAQCQYLGVDIKLLHDLAKLSTLHLQWLCPKDSKVTLKTTGRTNDDYGRLLAAVYVADCCVNEAMVEHGYAVAYQGYSDWESYQELEAYARESQRGIWGQCEESYYPASASSKTFHRPGCSSAPKTGTRLNSVKEAKAKGFKPCLVCIPDFRRV